MIKRFGLSRQKIFKGFASILLLGILYDMVFNFVDWRTANRNSAGIAPLPQETPETVVQVYAARTYSWRGYFAVHSWIATKPENAKSYTVYQVIGWKLYRDGSAVSIAQDIPDRNWYAQKPVLLGELRGKEAQEAIPLIEKAAQNYPYPNIYSAYPGPNSNTFISHILRSVPQLKVSLPPTAIGKDFIGYKKFIAPTESNTGWQFSILGILGISVGKVEGIEINILGMDFGIDFFNPALKLPFFGRIPG